MWLVTAVATSFPGTAIVCILSVTSSTIRVVTLNYRLVWLAPVILSWGCASVLDEDGALATAAYRIERYGRIVVDARVNGQGPFRFAIDTGASISVIFDELSKELALEPVPGKTLLIHGILASGEYPLVNVGRLEVGREAWIEPRVVSLPRDAIAGSSMEGILGLDFLRRYAVGFSTRERVVRLYPPELVSRRDYRGWTAIPLVPQYVGTSGAAIYVFEMQVNDQKIPAIFDLGAGVNALNWAAANSLGLHPVASKDDTVLSGAIESAPIVAELRIEEVITGRVRWRNEQFLVAELEIFDTLERADTPFAILGAELFNQRDFIIDFARNRLLVRFAMDEADLPGREDLEKSTGNDQ